MPAPKFETALHLIDEAHSQDPTTVDTPTTTPNPNGNNNKDDVEVQKTPYELHYATQTTKYLHLLTSTNATPPSEILQLAIRAQHLRRWEVPRNSYPMTKPGYYAWRSFLARRQGEIAEGICLAAGYSGDEAGKVGRLVRKEGLKKQGGQGVDGNGEGKGEGGGQEGGSEAEVQILEDVACLVFLEDRLEEFARGYDEEKLVGILRKTWGKMSGRAREVALGMELEGGLKRLVEKAVGG